MPARPADPGGSPADAIADLHSRLIQWATRRALAATSVTGISLILGVCAAIWFSAGTRTAELNGALVLSAGYLAAFTAREIAGRAAREDGVDGRAAWVVTMGTRLVDAAVYAGLAAGALGEGWTDMWALAISVLSLVAIRETMTACSAPAGQDRDGAGWRAVMSVLAMPAGGRVLLIVATAPLWGARASLLALLDWGIIAVGYGIGSGTAARRRNRKAPSRPSRPRSEPGALSVLLQPGRPPEQADVVVRPAGQPIQVLRMELAPPPPGYGPAADTIPGAHGFSTASDPGPASPADDTDPLGLFGGSGPWEPAEPGETAEDERPEPAGPAAGDRRQAMVLRCRDDGAISRWFGRPVRGQLVPLPPALLALAGVAMLAHLGLRDLPGLLILAPALIMLVAAPGSSHRHGGRFDWLVPAVLQGAQYIYIVALGSATRVPPPVTFALCAVIALHYADIGSPGSPSLPARRRSGPLAARFAAGGLAGERGAWLGWDGRMIVCGLGAAMGVATFAYLALAAYLGVLICWKFMTSSHGVGEGDRR